MKKFGIIIFIIAVLVGVVFANLFSFTRASDKIFGFSLPLSVKGSGGMKSEIRPTTAFTGVDVGGVFHVNIVTGKDFEIEVEADDNLLQYIRTEVRDGVLNIETTERVKSHSPLRVRIIAPSIESLRASGASNVSVAGLQNSKLNIDTSGASKIRVDGSTSRLEIEVSGASRIDASLLKSENAKVNASGASYVDLFVTGRLVSDASGASKVAYKGNPSSVEKNSSGAGRIVQK